MKVKIITVAILHMLSTSWIEENLFAELTRTVIKEEIQHVDKLIDDLRSAHSTIERIGAEKQELLKQAQKLDAELNQLKAFNAHLMDKERLLQYELTKSRAQSIGLEQICEDFKHQIEQLSSTAEFVKKKL